MRIARRQKDIPPGEDHARYLEWRTAQERLTEARDRLDSLSHLAESDPELLAAFARWRTARLSYGAICSAFARDP